MCICFCQLPGTIIPPEQFYIKHTVWCSSNHADSVNVDQDLCEVPILFINNQRSIFFCLSIENRQMSLLSSSVYQTYFFFLLILEDGALWSILALCGVPPLDLPKLHKAVKADTQGLPGLIKNSQSQSLLWYFLISWGSSFNFV